MKDKTRDRLETLAIVAVGVGIVGIMVFAKIQDDLYKVDTNPYQVESQVIHEGSIRATVVVDRVTGKRYLVNTSGGIQPLDGK